VAREGSGQILVAICWVVQQDFLPLINIAQTETRLCSPEGSTILGRFESSGHFQLTLYCRQTLTRPSLLPKQHSDAVQLIDR